MCGEGCESAISDCDCGSIECSGAGQSCGIAACVIVVGGTIVTLALAVATDIFGGDDATGNELFLAANPTSIPTAAPSFQPSFQPTVSAAPSLPPSLAPTAPTTSPTISPSLSPATLSPTTGAPSNAPTTLPSQSPSAALNGFADGSSGDGGSNTSSLVIYIGIPIAVIAVLFLIVLFVRRVGRKKRSQQPIADEYTSHNPISNAQLPADDVPPQYSPMDSTNTPATRIDPNQPDIAGHDGMVIPTTGSNTQTSLNNMHESSPPNSHHLQHLAASMDESSVNVQSRQYQRNNLAEPSISGVNLQPTHGPVGQHQLMSPQLQPHLAPVMFDSQQNTPSPGSVTSGSQHPSHFGPPAQMTNFAAVTTAFRPQSELQIDDIDQLRVRGKQHIMERVVSSNGSLKVIDEVVWRSSVVGLPIIKVAFLFSVSHNEDLVQIEYLTRSLLSAPLQVALNSGALLLSISVASAPIKSRDPNDIAMQFDVELQPPPSHESMYSDQKAHQPSPRTQNYSRTNIHQMSYTLPPGDLPKPTLNANSRYEPLAALEDVKKSASLPLQKQSPLVDPIGLSTHNAAPPRPPKKQFGAEIQKASSFPQRTGTCDNPAFSPPTSVSHDTRTRQVAELTRSVDSDSSDMHPDAWMHELTPPFRGPEEQNIKYIAGAAVNLAKGSSLENYTVPSFQQVRQDEMIPEPYLRGIPREITDNQNGYSSPHRRYENHHVVPLPTTSEPAAFDMSSIPPPILFRGHEDVSPPPIYRGSKPKISQSRIQPGYHQHTKSFSNDSEMGVSEI